MLGPWETTIVGAVFGLTSMWKASAFYVGIGDAVFSPSMSGKPLESLILSVGTRTLFGLIVGILFYIAKKQKYPLPWIILTASIGRIIHTTLVYGCMWLFFPEAGFGLQNVPLDITRWDFIPFTIIAAAIVVLSYFLRQSAFLKRLLMRIHEVDQINSMIMPKKRGQITVIILVLLSSFSVAVYFINRIETVMRQYQITLSEEITYDLMHLQIQFLLGIISLAILVILDIDSFKAINDNYGHPAGDQILKEVAQNLSASFGDGNIYGRLGGDEFVALILEPLSKQEVEEALNKMKARLEHSKVHGVAVTCSIGVIPIEKEYPLEKMYKHADRLLYEAKKNGKNQFVFGYRYRDLEENSEM